MADDLGRSLNHLYESKRHNPDRSSAYIDRINKLYNLVYPTGTRERTNADRVMADVLGYKHEKSFIEGIFGLPRTPDRKAPARVALEAEHSLFPRDQSNRRLFEKHLLENILYLKNERKLETHPNRDEIIDTLDSIWRESPRTSGGRFVQEHAEDLVMSKYSSARKAKDIRDAFQRKIEQETAVEEGRIPAVTIGPDVREPTPEEVDFITRLESRPNIARNSSQKFRTAGPKNSDKPWDFTIEGQYLVLNLNTMTQYIVDPLTGKKVPVKQKASTLLDGDGRVIEEKLFAQTSREAAVDGELVALERLNAEEARKAFATAVRGNLIFNEIYGLGKKLNVVMDLDGLGKKGKVTLPENIKKKARLFEAFYGDEEGEERMSSFAMDLAKDYAGKFSSKIERYFAANPHAEVNEVNMMRALGLRENQIMKCYVGGEFQPLEAMVYIQRNGMTFPTSAFAKLANPSDPTQMENRRMELARNAVLGHIGNFYISYGFKEVPIPYKGREGEKEFNAYYTGWSAYQDRGFAPEYIRSLNLDEELRFEEEIERLKASGPAGAARAKEIEDTRMAVEANAEFWGAYFAKKLFDTNGFSDAPKDNVEIIPGGPGGFRIKIQTPDFRTLYLDPEDAYEYQVRTGNIAQAIAIRNQIQQFANDPLTYPVTWYYQSIGNMMLNIVPGARQAFDVTNNILHQRNSLLPKFKQLDPKQLAEISKVFIKKNLLSPMFVYDPMTNLMIPRTAYLLGQSVETMFQFLVGNKEIPGFLDRKLRDANIRVWKYDSTDKKFKLGVWEPRIFKSVFQNKRQKKRMGIFEIALRMTAGVMFNMIGGYIFGKVKQFATVAHYVRQYSQIPQNIYSKILPESGGILSQQGVRNVINWTKTGWGLGGSALRALGNSIIPAVIVGLAFNSPAALIIAGTTALVPNLLIEVARFTASPAGSFFGGKFESFDTLGKLLFKSHIDASQVFQSTVDINNIPKLFGLENLIYDKTRFVLTETIVDHTGYDIIEKYGYAKRTNFLNKYLLNHAGIRGMLKGIGRSLNVLGIVYLVTGNIGWAVAAAAGTMAASITYERIAAWAQKSISTWQGALHAGASVVKGGATLLMSGANIAIGLSVIKKGLEAFYAGDEEWQEWKSQYIIGVIPFATTALTLIGAVKGILTAYNTAIGLGKFLVNKFQSLAVASIPAFGKYAKIGMILGMIAGAIIGGILGGSVGAIAGGAIAGAIGGVIGGIVGSLFFGIGTVAGGIVGSLLGGFIAGLGGGIIGSWIDRNVQRIKGIGSTIAAGINILGNAMNILHAIQMLLGRDLGDVAVGIFMLAIAGVFTFSSIQHSSLTAATYMASDGSGERIGHNETPLIPQIEDFKKTFIGFEDEGRTLVYEINSTNTDPNGNSIEIKYLDILTVNTTQEIIVEAPDVNSSRSIDKVNVEEVDFSRINFGERKALIIKFKSNTKFNGIGGIIEEQTDEKICNTGQIVGQVIETGKTFSNSSTVCIDKDGNKVSEFPTGTFIDCNGETPITAPNSEVKMLPDSSRAGKCIIPTQIVLHWSAGSNTPGARYGIWDTLASRGVSCHLNVDPSGSLQSLGFYDTYVEMSWCQGPVFNVNSISMEIAGSNFDKTHARHVSCTGDNCIIDGGPNESGYRPPTEEQIVRVEELVCWMMAQYNLTKNDITGHLFAPYQAPYEDYAMPTCKTAHPIYGTYGCKWDPGYIWLKEFKDNLNCSEYGY